MGARPARSAADVDVRRRQAWRVDQVSADMQASCVATGGVFRRVDAVTVPVPDLDAGLRFYRQALGHRLKWRNDTVGQAGLELPDGDSELVLTTRQSLQPNWLVNSVDDAVEVLTEHGSDLVAGPFDIPVGRAAVVRDPFGNTLILVDLSKGTYTTDHPTEPTSKPA
jgi:predicted enzyme related to lactoylglutathione lyase